MAGLSGMKAICQYCGRHADTITIWIRDYQFPAAKITGGWESDTDLIDEWRVNYIKNYQNGKKKSLKSMQSRRKL